MKTGTYFQDSNLENIIDEEFFEIRKEWKNFYKTHFNWNVNFSQVIIPSKPDGKWLLIFVPSGIKLKFYFSLRKKNKSCRYFNEAFVKNIYTINEPYAKWVRDESESNQESFENSILPIVPSIEIGAILLEKIIFEIKYFTENVKHLEIKDLTFCSISHDEDVYHIPGSYFKKYGKLCIHWRNIGHLRWMSYC